MAAHQLGRIAALTVIVTQVSPCTSFVLPFSTTTKPLRAGNHYSFVSDHVQHGRPLRRSVPSRLIADIERQPAVERNNRHGRCSALLQMNSSPNGEGGERSGKVSDSTDPGSDEDSKGIYGFDQEIVAREQAEAPLRRVRLIAYGVFAVVSLALGGVSIAGLAGVEDFKELSENLPNPLIDLGVLGLSFYFWVEEVKTKRSALKLLQKRREAKLRGPNRRERRLLESEKKRQSTESTIRNKPSITSIKTNDSPTNVQQQEQSPSEGQQPSEEDGKEGGMFDGIRKTLEAVNQQSYYQALALNKELEEKGVLPKLESVPELPRGTKTSAGADEGVPEIQGNSDGQGVRAEEASIVAVTGDGERELVSEKSGVDKRPRRKGGKKGKRRK